MKVKPTFDEYIISSQEFARPILNYLRKLIHQTYPAIQEQIKWNFPCFIYKGSNLVYMAGFKQHATFGFWLSKEMSDSQSVFVVGEKTGMGNFGKLTSIEDLPRKEILREYLLEAMDLIDRGVKIHSAKKEINVQKNADLLHALSADPNLNLHFRELPPSQRKDYHEWINEAKTETTRDKRITQAIEWISEGKPRNWKYMKSWKGKS